MSNFIGNVVALNYHLTSKGKLEKVEYTSFIEKDRWTLAQLKEVRRRGPRFGRPLRSPHALPVPGSGGERRRWRF